MTAPFVSELRVTDDVIVVRGGDGAVLRLRVQAADLWDALRVDAPESASVASVKAAAFQAFYPGGAATSEFIVKLRGFEILDENATLAASGVKDGSTLLIAWRKRRPVR